jgi:threonine dehydrogenase-like Zn-dependent dehydrogenase
MDGRCDAVGLDIARKLGAAQAVTDASALGGARFNVAVDATGVPDAIEAAIGLLDRGGRMLVFGVSPTKAAITAPNRPSGHLRIGQAPWHHTSGGIASSE